MSLHREFVGKVNCLFSVFGKKFFFTFSRFSRERPIGLGCKDRGSMAPVLGYRMAVFLWKMDRWLARDSREDFAFRDQKKFFPAAFFHFRENRDFSRSRDPIRVKTPPGKMVGSWLFAGRVSSRSDRDSPRSKRTKSVTHLLVTPLAA